MDEKSVELKEKLEKEQLQKSPEHVVIKSYVQGNPIDLISIVTTMFKSLNPKKPGEKIPRYALTLMVEELY